MTSEREARFGFSDWLAHRFQHTSATLSEVSEAADMDYERLCRILAGEVMPTDTEAAQLAWNIALADTTEGGL